MLYGRFDAGMWRTCGYAAFVETWPDAALRLVRKNCRARRNNSGLGILARLQLDLYRSRMLLHDDVVSDGQAKAGTLSGWLGREEGIEHLFPHFKGNAAAVVANRDLDAVAKVLRRSRKSRLKAFTRVLPFTFTRRIEAVGDQVQESACDLLREYIDLTRVVQY